MTDYQHHVRLSYKTTEQLNRHAKRLIDSEGFMSAGMRDVGEYGFVKYIDEAEFNRLVSYGRKATALDSGKLKIVYEERTAW